MTLSCCHDLVSCCPLQLVEANECSLVAEVEQQRYGGHQGGWGGGAGGARTALSVFPHVSTCRFHRAAHSQRSPVPVCVAHPFPISGCLCQLGELRKHLAFFWNDRESNPRAYSGYPRCPGTKTVTPALIRTSAPALGWGKQEGASPGS